jgi:hypothetical protein
MIAPRLRSEFAPTMTWFSLRLHHNGQLPGIWLLRFSVGARSSRITDLCRCCSFHLSIVSTGKGRCFGLGGDPHIWRITLVVREGQPHVAGRNHHFFHLAL